MKSCPLIIKNGKETPDLAVLGASTGGPGAIIKVLSSLGADNALSIIIVQHIEASFISGFVQWIQTELNRSVEVAREGSSPYPGRIYVAGASGNLELSDDFKFRYVRAPQGQLYTPNINHLFCRLAGLPIKANAALLTGMGDDGALGLKELADRGWSTFVQSPSSCVVSGMPDAAVKLSPRHTVATPEDIGKSIQTYALSTRRRNYARNS